MKRILITGSRDWTDRDAIYEALSLENLCWEHDECDHIYTVVHGDCPTGADRLAKSIANQLGWSEEPHPAAWMKNGKLDRRAGYIRNAEMVDLGADVCLAFIKDDSKGSTHCSTLAEKAGIPTKVWRA